MEIRNIKIQNMIKTYENHNDVVVKNVLWMDLHGKIMHLPFIVYYNQTKKFIVKQYFLREFSIVPNSRIGSLSSF